MGRRPSNIVFATFVLVMGMIVAAIGAGWHYWPEVVVGLIAFVGGLAWTCRELLRS